LLRSYEDRLKIQYIWRGVKMFRLKDKVAIITGATSGIGQASAILFAKEGASVAAVGRSIERGEQTVGMIKDSGGEATFIRTDISIAEDVEEMVRIAVDRYGRLDILYNNAAIVHEPASTVDMEVREWENTIDTNLTGSWLCMKYAIPEMINNVGGSIINTASLAAKVGVPNQIAYSATKGGIISMSRVAAVEYANKGIRVNCIAPGPTATPMLVGFYREDGVRYLSGLNPRGCLGMMEEVAHLALFLASDESCHIIGQTLSVDGGHTIDSHIRW
jgi:NAD(P)-dependent dehydrogenase (short-subunit alcohol dehydrogenase family)